jgi:hypothetical protein
MLCCLEVLAIAGLSNQVTVFDGPFSERYHELDGKTVDVRPANDIDPWDMPLDYPADAQTVV